MSGSQSVVRGTTIVDATGASRTHIAVPLRRRRLTTGTPEEVVREFNGQIEDIHQATLDARSLPFGGPKTVVFVTFTTGVNQRIAHGLKTAKVIALLGIPTVPSAGTASVSIVSVDETNATLRPTGTFTAPVFFMVTP